VGGITSSRCTNEETYLVQKLVRAAFGNNNVDTCARVCHSPTGYGLKTTLGESAGTQAFDSVMKATSSSSSAPTRPTATRCSRRA
jgi:formate dehydrogenase major subunit